MASDNSGLIKLGIAAGVGWYAYSQGWLSFLGIGGPAGLLGSNMPPVVAIVPTTVTGGAVASSSVGSQATAAQIAAAQAAAQAAAAAQIAAAQRAAQAAAQAAADQAAQDQINLINSMSRRRVGVNPIPIAPVDIRQRQTGRQSTIAGSLSGYRLRGMYGR